MAGIILIDDDFATLALDAQLSGRIPPVRDGGQVYGVEPDAASITGGGSNTIKFNVIGASFKIPMSAENLGVQLVYNDNGVNELIHIFLRDSQPTVSNRYGYWVRFETRAFGGTSGFFRIASVNNYSSVALYPDITWTFASSGINKVAFECNANNFRVIINDVVANTFTDTTWPPNGSRNKCGVYYTTTGISASRGTRFTIFDSIVIPLSSVEYPIVRFG